MNAVLRLVIFPVVFAKGAALLVAVTTHSLPITMGAFVIAAGISYWIGARIWSGND